MGLYCGEKVQAEYIAFCFLETARQFADTKGLRHLSQKGFARVMFGNQAGQLIY